MSVEKKAETTKTLSSTESTKSAFERLKGDKNPNEITATQNNAISFSTTQSAVLDFFFGSMVRGAVKEKVENTIAAGWAENPVDTIRVLMHGRDARNGKGEKLVVLHALIWLRRNKPGTYLLNLPEFLQLGYFKDLLNIAAEVEIQKLDKLGEHDIIELEVLAEFLRHDKEAIDKENEEAKKMEVDEEVEKKNENEEEAMKDEDKLKKSKAKHVSISLAGKWAPSEIAHFDKKFKFAKRLAKLLFPESQKPRVEYRKLVGALRTKLQVVERFMCAKEWEKINYQRVPAKASRILAKAFKKHDLERYQAYLEQVAAGKAKINTTGIQPHELASKYFSSHEKDDTTELQWRTLVDKLRVSGKLSQALSIVDVSGSMSCKVGGSTTAMQVAVALGLLTAELSAGSFHNHVITFHEDPSIVALKKETLCDRVHEIRAMPWGMSTNIQKVFDLILSTAQSYSTPASEMPKTLFVFSDMQFNVAFPDCNGVGLTNHEALQAKYAAVGYELPLVVYWNLNGKTCNDFPVQKAEKGVALISGFSGELLKLFMDADGDINPYSLMLTAIGKYVAVVDDSEIGAKSS